MPNIESGGETSTAPALDRGLQVVELFAEGDEYSLEDIAASLSFPKSSLTRILATLVMRSYLQRSPTTKKYSSLISIQRVSHQHHSIKRLVQEALEQLSAKTQLTVEWFSISPKQAELTQRVEAEHGAIQVRAQIGFTRNWWSEVDALSKIGHSMLHPKGSAKQQSSRWEYQEGDEIVLTPRQCSKRIAEVDNQLLVVDKQYNTNGIRRMAKGILDSSGSLIGIIALASHFHPKADSLQESQRHLLNQYGNKLQSRLNSSITKSSK